VFVANQYASAVGLDAGTGEMLWQVTDPELPDATSPVATPEHVFMGSSYGTFTCLDATDGSTVWTHEFDTGSYASPILVNDLIYLTDMDGVTHAFKASGRYESVAKGTLGESCVATPAFVGNRIYMRGKKHLYCIGTE
jgi:outer membrane protein assembly factor BamB